MGISHAYRVEHDHGTVYLEGTREECISYISSHILSHQLNLVNNQTGRAESWHKGS